MTVHTDIRDITADPQLTDLISRLRDINSKLADLTAAADDIKSQIRQAVPAGARALIDGQPAVTVSANRRFDPDLAKTVLPPELVQLCLVEKVDGAQAKRNLPPAVYEQLMTDVGQPVVRLT